MSLKFYIRVISISILSSTKKEIILLTRFYFRFDLRRDFRIDLRRDLRPVERRLGMRERILRGLRVCLRRRFIERRALDNII